MAALFLDAVKPLEIELGLAVAREADARARVERHATALAELEREYHEVRRREKIDLTEEDRARILSLAKDLPDRE